MKWDAKKELEAERAALIDELEKSATQDKAAERQRLGETRVAAFTELEAVLSPEIACQVEKAIDR
jgi:hypothetical protein